MAERRLVDVLPDGTIRGVETSATAQLASRAGRFWLHDSHPELTLLTFAGLEAPAEAAPSERVMLAVDLTALSPIDILGMVAQSRLSLRAFCVRQGVERIVLFRDGEVVTVASNRPEDRIGELLVRMGLVEQERIEEALSQAAGTGKRAGQILVESGLITSHDLWEAIQTQVLELFCDVCTWESGHLVGYLLPEGFAFPKMPSSGTQGLLLEAVRRADELTMLRKKIPDDNVALEATGHSQGVNQEEQRCLAQLAQPQSVAELARALRMTTFDASRLVYSLLQSGAVRIAVTGAREMLRSPEAGRADEVVRVFNMAMGEMQDELKKAGVHDRFVEAIDAYLADPKSRHTRFFKGLALQRDGGLIDQLLLANAAAAGPQDREQLLSEALNDLLFFGLFQCGELLESSVDIDLARRVRLIYSMLDES